ncbi:MAG: ribosome maturation factor RimM, partial [Actinobacteria bacterium]|nr:ribosome maturation factor RimM [Actinomycetota bacterium]
GRAHGVRGDLFVEPMTDEPDHRFADGTVLMTSDNTTLTVATSKWHSGRFVVHFAGVDDRNAAEALRGQTLTIEVDPAELPEDPDEFYDHQLVGLKVALKDGSLIGVIGEVIHLPSQDLLSVKREGDTEVLIPFVMEFVPEIDLDSKTVTITPPPGLLNELDAIVVRDEEV